MWNENVAPVYDAGFNKSEWHRGHRNGYNDGLNKIPKQTADTDSSYELGYNVGYLAGACDARLPM